jgi:hypothetical protein
MMPEAGRVIDAARLVVSALPGFTGRTEAIEALREALAALDAKLANAGHEPTREEQERTWGEVVEGDEILSPKTNRWYEITRTVTNKGRVKLNIKGSPKPIERDRTDRVQVRRGVTGESMDILEVLWSAQTRPTETPVSKEAGPMLTEKVDDDEE